MRNVMSSSILIAIVTLLLLSPGIVRAEKPPCMFPDNGVCAVERFAMKYSNNSGPEEYCNRVDGKYCLLREEYMPEPIPPAPAWVHCNTVDAYTQQCTAWPQGDLHFRWAVSWELETEHWSGWSGPSQKVFCRESHGSGTVSVTITTPDGLSDTVFHGVSCGSTVQ